MENSVIGRMEDQSGWRGRGSAGITLPQKLAQTVPSSIGAASVFIDGGCATPSGASLTTRDSDLAAHLLTIRNPGYLVVAILFATSGGWEMPIEWKQAIGDELTLLQNLQPNIIKPHVREFLTVLFLHFDDADGGKDFIGRLSGLMKSAHDHLVEIVQFKDHETPGSAYIGFGLSAPGYDVLKIAPVPSDRSFQSGMDKTIRLNDPPISEWEQHFQKPNDLHAVVVIGDMLRDDRNAARARVQELIDTAAGVTVIGTQEGVGQHNSNGQGIEHFGYVDGRSQPLFLIEDIRDEENQTDGIANWDPTSPLSQVIIPDPAAPDPNVHFGSYFIFRKLEQNVKLFKKMEIKFAEDLPIDDDERAGAMIVGRFEDGTPVTLQSEDGVESPVPNNFNYNSDKSGAKCPFLGHIRKTNPRGSGGFGQTFEQEHSHLMARRGQTYGVRTDNPNDGAISNKPEKDVGLLFMAFNSDIRHQFEFTQITWANNPNFPEVPAGSPPPGLDPVIGQLPRGQVRPDMAAPKCGGILARCRSHQQCHRPSP
jgi:deferrochelatase/peroxidase EfeB